MRTPQQTNQRQRGFSLVEALIALLVLSLGVLAMSKLQSHLRLNADVATQRSEAVRLAQEELEAMRSFATLTAAKGTRSYADIAASSSTLAPGASRPVNTSFHVDRAIGEGNGFRTVSVAVDWPDRAGRTQRIALQSVVAATPPGLAGALALRGNARPTKSVF